MSTKAKALETEILRDLPLLHQKIAQCHTAKLDFERAIIKEEQDQMALRLAMMEDANRVAAGKRPHYEKESMLANIERHSENIKTFRESIAKENASIERFQGMIKVLEEDLQRPEEITIDMRDKSGPKFRNLDQ